MIDKLNLHYAFTNPASIHDEEALTALELAGRQGAKINEVVDAQNNLKTKTDNKMAEQDNYIKTEIPKEVDSQIKSNINSGTFEREIDRYAGNLDARVNNLLGQVVEGTTSGDAELIDARTGANNYVYANTGEAIREVTAQLGSWAQTITENVIFASFESGNAQEGYQWKNDLSKFAIASSDYAKYYVSEMPVEAGDLLRVKCGAHYDSFAYVFLDDNNKKITEMYISASKYTEFEGVLIVPPMASKIRVGWAVGNGLGTSGYVTKATEIYFKPANEESVNNLSAILKTAGLKFTEVEDELISGFIDSNGNFTQHDAVEVYGMYKNALVEGGKIYHMMGCAHYNGYVFILRDKYGNIIDSLKAGGDAHHVEELDTIYVMPYNAHSIDLCGNMYGTKLKRPLLAEATEMVTSQTGQGKTWVTFGDSLTEKNDTASTNYVDLVSADLGFTPLNYGASGTGYKRDEIEGSVNYTAWHTRINNLADVEFDVITLFGSGNDLGYTLGNVTDIGTTTVCGCINKTLDALFNMKPDAKVGIITPTPWASYPTNVSGNKMELYSEALVEIAKRRGLPCLDLYHNSGLRPEVASFNNLFFSNGDGCHPNDAGHKLFYPMVREFVRSLI